MATIATTPLPCTALKDPRPTRTKAQRAFIEQYPWRLAPSLPQRSPEVYGRPFACYDDTMSPGEKYFHR